MLYAVMLAYGGRAADATREIEEGMARVARANRNDDESNYARLLSARGYVAREQYDKAVDALERLVRVPDFITPGWLKVDPTFKPLRGNARFERLLQAPRA